MSPNAEPDLLPSTLQAVRAWDMVPEGGTGRTLLGSIAQAMIWPTGGFTAECLAGQPHSVGPPAPGCSCGVYAFHPYAVEGNRLFDAPDHEEVLGVIETRGRVEVHEAGIRAEHADIVALLVEVSAGEEYLAQASRAAATYGAELVPLNGAEQFKRYLRDEVRGLDQGYVERLLADSLRHQFEPRASGYISRRGQPVGGFGYVLRDRPVVPKRFQNRVNTYSPSIDVIRVVGARYREQALQAESFDPGRALELIPEPGNPHDPNAVAVWDASLDHHVGYVTRGIARRIGSRLGAGRIAAVRSTWQWRDLRSGRRTGLHIAVSAAPHLEFIDAEQLELDDPGEAI